MYLLINNSYNDLNPKATPMLIKYFSKKKIEIKVINTKYDLVKHLKNKKKIKGIILSGSDLSYSENFCHNMLDINILALLEFDIPILGICFGFQTIGLFYGGTINRLKNLNKGKQKINLYKNELFNNITNNNFYQYHQDYLVKIPPNFKIIAKEKKIINGIKHKDKPIYGVQFHPELSGNTGFKIIDNFIHICTNY